jgi:hypothetical protein
MVAKLAPITRPMTTSKRVISKCRIRLPSDAALKNRNATMPGPGKIKAGNFHNKMAASHKTRAMIMVRMKNNVRCLLSLLNKTKTPIHDSSGRICRQAVYILISSLLLSGLYRRPRNFTGSCPELDSWASLMSYHRSGIGSSDPHPAPKVFILYMFFRFLFEFYISIRRIFHFDSYHSDGN